MYDKIHYKLKKKKKEKKKILAWRNLWTEETDGLQSIVLQRVRHDFATKQALVYTNIYNT